MKKLNTIEKISLGLLAIVIVVLGSNFLAEEDKSLGADSKISQLPAITIPASTDEFAINETGVSKKITLAEIIGGTTTGSIPFVDSTGVLTQVNSRLFYSKTGIKLGIGINTPDGTLHVNTGSAGAIGPSSFVNDLTIENSDDAGMTILSPDTEFSAIEFGSPSRQAGALMRWRFTDNLFTLGTFNTGADVSFAPGLLNEAIRLKSTGEVLIGTSIVDSSSKLKIDSTTQGFLPPRMTTTQRDAVSSPTAGLMIYNTTTNLINFFNGTVWGAI